MVEGVAEVQVVEDVFAPLGRVKPPIDWLLQEGPPWVRLGVFRDILARPSDDPDTKTALAETENHPFVRKLLTDSLAWPEPPLTGHQKPDHPFHKAELLAHFLPTGHRFLVEIAGRMLANLSPEGIPLTLMKIPERYGGSGEPGFAWMTCDYPLLLWITARAGLVSEIGAAYEHLLELVMESGWPCASSIMGWRGPGRKADPCPYATLLALKALSGVHGALDSKEARIGVRFLLWHWENSRERPLYMFGAGKRYRQVKFPPHWYDVLHVAWVLSWFPFARREGAFKNIMDHIASSADPSGKFTPESIYNVYKGLDFGQKKEPSPTLTWFAWSILISNS